MSKSDSYRIKKGDKWSTIGKKFGLTATQLAKHNDRPKQTRLKTGEIIAIPKTLDRIAMVGIKKEVTAFKKFNKKLVTNRAFRAQFLKSPAKKLKEFGIEVDADLLPKDYPVLRLMDDVKFKDLAKKGDIAKTRAYLEKKYPEIIPPSPLGPAHVADAVEAVAVLLPAVAIADPIC